MFNVANDCKAHQTSQVCNEDYQHHLNTHLLHNTFPRLLKIKDLQQRLPIHNRLRVHPSLSPVTFPPNHYPPFVLMLSSISPEAEFEWYRQSLMGAL